MSIYMPELSHIRKWGRIEKLWRKNTNKNVRKKRAKKTRKRHRKQLDEQLENTRRENILLNSSTSSILRT